MAQENEFLDEEFNVSDLGKTKKKFNYSKYAIPYVFLMLTVGPLFIKQVFNMNMGWWQLSKVSFMYVGFALFVSAIFIGVSYLFNKVISGGSKKRYRHPLWFRMLEYCFLTWVFILIFMYVGVKFF